MNAKNPNGEQKASAPLAGNCDYEMPVRDGYVGDNGVNSPGCSKHLVAVGMTEWYIYKHHKTFMSDE